MNRATYNYLLLLLFMATNLLRAGSFQLDKEALYSLSSPERSKFIHGLRLESLDSAAFLSAYYPLLAFAEADKDWRMAWDLRFQYFLQRGNLQCNSQENIELLTRLKETATEEGFEIGQIIVQHYLVFEKYYTEGLPHGAVYTNALQEFEQMRDIGFEKFIDYQLIWMLYHNGRFMYELGDLDKAFQFLRVAEKFIEPTESGGYMYILILNHLQAMYQQKHNVSEGIRYAQKILQFAQNPPSKKQHELSFYRQWQGLSSSDIAAMLVSQGKYAESEPYANQAYQLSISTDTTDLTMQSLEYTALQVLVSTKLEMGALMEAVPLMHRLDMLYEQVGGMYEHYFNNIKYFECRARFHEMKSEFAEAVHFSKLAQPLKDSLSRRNDARHLEQLKQRLESEKYTEKLRLLEKERALQMWLRNAAFIILALVLALAYIYFKRLNRQRQERIAELEKAKKALAEMVQNFRQKSAMAESLRSEIEKLAQAGERSEYLEQLTNSTILTEDDWLGFRQLFEKVHPGYLEQLKISHPALTPAEIRYLTLEKLHLNTHEMTKILGVTASAIRKARARMRKKVKQGGLY